MVGSGLMKKVVLTVVAVGAVAAGVFYYRDSDSAGAGTNATAADGAGNGAPGGARGGRGGGGFGGGQFGRPPLTVELAPAKRMSITSEITVVGNLVGEATVSVAPRAAGRLQDISVRLGDRVVRGQRIARIEDFEIQEQVKQAEAALEVALATIRQREADLSLAKTNAERSRSLYERQLLPKQTLDDNEARYQSAIAALDLARAQNAQSKARLDELRINLANMVITSPVTGFVSKRLVDPGAFVSQQSPVAEVVDVTSVRLEANIVERDLKQLKTGDPTRVEVDAFPGEHFMGRIARVSPVLDPATRTAPIEIEIPNSGFRLKPGMYARVGILTGTKKDALVVPNNAVVDLGGRRGVFMPLNQSAAFRTLQLGTESNGHIEVLSGLNEGDMVITTGAGALRDGDRIQIAGEGGRRGAAPGRAGRGAGMEGEAEPGTSAPPASATPANALPRRGRTGGDDTPPAATRPPDVERGSGRESPAGVPAGEGGVSRNGRRGGLVNDGRPKQS
jgi:HlyD family secretion protein